MHWLWGEVFVGLLAAAAAVLPGCWAEIATPRPSNELRPPLSLLILGTLCIGFAAFIAIEGYRHNIGARRDLWAWVGLLSFYTPAGFICISMFVRWRLWLERNGIRIQRTFRTNVFVPWTDVRYVTEGWDRTLWIVRNGHPRLKVSPRCRGILKFVATAEEKGAVLDASAVRAVLLASEDAPIVVGLKRLRAALRNRGGDS